MQKCNPTTKTTTHATHKTNGATVSITTAICSNSVTCSPPIMHSHTAGMDIMPPNASVAHTPTVETLHVSCVCTSLLWLWSFFGRVCCASRLWRKCNLAAWCNTQTLNTTARFLGTKRQASSFRGLMHTQCDAASRSLANPRCRPAQPQFCRLYCTK